MAAQCSTDLPRFSTVRGLGTRAHGVNRAAGVPWGMILARSSLRLPVLAALATAGTLASGAPRVRLPVFTTLFAQVAPDALPVPETGLRPADQAFLVGEIQVSRTGTELSRLALAQASSSDVRDFAQQLLGDYDQMETALEGLARRKAVDVPVQPTSYSKTYRDLAGNSGDSFDRAFLRQIAADAGTALRQCENALEHSRDSDVRALAGNLLPTLRAHVNRITDLQKTL
ncbi:MAG TPA: DUF4142 domain-containing protein [Opitutaceae bacterium]|nr:DUF4142 domain-containing protein [Opitutaceae bacterium]